MDGKISHFRGEELTGDISPRPGKGATLTAWFVENSEYPGDATGAKYRDSQKHFAWLATHRKWKPMSRRHPNTAGRMYPADPVEGGRFPLRLLLTDFTGCKSYDFVKSLPIGTVCEAFREAAASRGLLCDGGEHYIAFDESASHATHRAISMIFDTIIAYFAPGSPRTTWGTFAQHLAEGGSDEAIDKAVFRLSEDLRAVGSPLAAFPSLPKLSHERMNPQNGAQFPEFETGPKKVIADTHIPLLNAEKTLA